MWGLEVGLKVYGEELSFICGAIRGRSEQARSLTEIGVGAFIVDMQSVTFAKMLRALERMVLVMVVGGLMVGKAMGQGPELRRGESGVTQLYVKGKPMLVLGGELGNSTASDLKVMEGVWGKLKGMNLNTVLVPVYWDRVEPVEGKFDWSLVRGAIEGARRHEMKVVLLWFGSWKNSMSCYAPGWVKRDEGRFPRVRKRNGEAEEIVSPFSREALEADARAFGEMMKWVKGFDERENTVVMVQVENEVGMIPEARDHSELAEAAWRGAVPSELIDGLMKGVMGPEVQGLWEKAGKRSGSWAEVFGESAWGDEVFTAWSLAKYVEEVAARGKREYGLPMFVNAALMRPGYEPGRYPGGGPLPHLMEVWKLAAPSVDMLCPDVYFPNFSEWVGKYRRGGNGMFVPEMAASWRVGGNAVVAIGKYGSMGVAPFAIEDQEGEKGDIIGGLYGVLRGMEGLVLEKQAEGKGGVTGMGPEVGFGWEVSKEPARAELGGVVFEGRFDAGGVVTEEGTTVLPTLGAHRWDAPAGTPRGGVMIVQVGEEEFVLVGMGVVVTFAPKDGKGKVGIEWVQEGRFEEGKWVGGRWLNGDQTHQGRHVHLYDGAWRVQRVKVYRYGG